MNDFMKGLSVGIVILILYILLQPSQNGRYVFRGTSSSMMLDTKTGDLYRKPEPTTKDPLLLKDDIWKKVRTID